MDSRIRVGIADDDDFMCTMLGHLFRRAEDAHLVATARNGLEAVALAGTGTVQVLILDLDMPIMNGFEALKRIRVIAPDVRVVIYSGQPARRAAEMLDAGAAAYVEKPSGFDVLLETVREVASSKARQLC